MLVAQHLISKITLHKKYKQKQTHVVQGPPYHQLLHDVIDLLCMKKKKEKKKNENMKMALNFESKNRLASVRGKVGRKQCNLATLALSTGTDLAMES